MVKKYRAMLLLVGSYACNPNFDDRPSEVTNYRVLAVQAEPAEWTRVIDPDTGVTRSATYRALFVNPLGTVDNGGLRWAFCSLPKPLTELNDVSIECFQNDPAYITDVGMGPQISAAVPENACRQFGPDIPEDQAYRPADPDVTGGYYQPLRVNFIPSASLVVPTMAKVRIRCGLPGASSDQTTRYNRSYHLNANPAIDSLAVDGSPVADGAEYVVAAGQRVSIQVTWPVCPLTDTCGDGICGPAETKETGDGNCDTDCKPTEKSCGGAERYLDYRLETRTLGEAREVMRASWYGVAGSFRDDRTGRESDDVASFSENAYTLPTTPGGYPIWVVLRDDRGGLGWRSVHFTVR